MLEQVAPRIGGWGGWDDQGGRAAVLIVGNLKRRNCRRYKWKQSNSGVSAEREGTREVTHVDAVCGECAGESVALDNDLGIRAVLTIVGRSSEIGRAVACESAHQMHFIHSSHIYG